MTPVISNSGARKEQLECGWSVGLYIYWVDFFEQISQLKLLYKELLQD